MGFPDGLIVKNLPANAGDIRLGFDPRVGKNPWKRKWQATPVPLPGESHGQRSLAGYSPWGHKQSDMTEVTEHTGMPPKNATKRITQALFLYIPYLHPQHALIITFVVTVEWYGLSLWLGFFSPNVRLPEECQVLPGTYAQCHVA